MVPVVLRITLPIKPFTIVDGTVHLGPHLRDKTIRLLVGQAGLLAHHHREETLRLHVGEAGHLAHPHREETVHLAHRLAGSAGLASPAHEPHDDMLHGPSGGSHHLNQKNQSCNWAEEVVDQCALPEHDEPLYNLIFINNINKQMRQRLNRTIESLLTDH